MYRYNIEKIKNISEDADKLTALLQEDQPEPAAYKSKTGGVIEMLEDMLDKAKEEK